MQRKNDHIQEALKQTFMPNDFDKIRFEPVLLPETDIDKIDLSTEFLGQTFKYPVFINAMTGGTEKAHAINDHLSQLAAKHGLAMATGSAAITLRAPETKESFSVIRKNHPQGFILANIGADKSADNAAEIVAFLKADALQIHCNAPQEAVMPEGERNFIGWAANIKAMVKKVNVPTVVKNVGFGMTAQDIKTLKELGVKTIDVAGSGGTNFITIENARRNHPIDGFKSYGFSTVESLLEAEKVPGVEIIASGGIRNAYDVIKALNLGAKAVGLSRYFLELAVNYSLDEADALLIDFLDDLKKITALLGATNILELQEKPRLLDASLISFINQRP
jgi:isopentenyl-diphosphate delta-isomerase